MQNIELPLFSSEFIEKTEPESDQKLITEERIIAPLAQVFNSTTPPQIGNTESLTKSLNELFPEQAYDDKSIQKTKEILGAISNGLTTEQIMDINAEIQFLVTTWLDDFERKTYGGKTLKELLHEKGAL